jgi:putative N6-adenine-specific DNA methylase
MRLIAKTLEGLENVLAEEIRDLGGENITPVNRAVIFEGNKVLLYKSNLMLRTALKVLVFMDEFDVTDETDLYGRVKAIKWEEYFSIQDTFAIDSVVNSDKFRHSNYVSLKCKDAIADRFRDRTGERPNVDVQDPTIRINVHIRNHTVTLSLDSTGRSLHMRGYRRAQVDAPLNEALAAGLILSSGWDCKKTLIDPMCGSGTILIEAAMLAKGISPQHPDKRYALKKWLNFDEELWKMCFDEAYLPKNDELPTIKGYDVAQKAIKISNENISYAGFENAISLEQEDFFFTEGTQDAILIFNPPYDARLKEEDVLNFYKFIGDKLKNSYAGCEAWILSGHIEAMKNVGLRPSRRMSFLNGSIPSVFHKFEMYSGSKRQKFQNPTNDEL